MKTLIIALILLFTGCGVPPGAYYNAINSGYPGGYGSQQYVNNLRALQYQQALDRQNLLMQQQNMILQQRRY